MSILVALFFRFFSVPEKNTKLGHFDTSKQLLFNFHSFVSVLKVLSCLPHSVCPPWCWPGDGVPWQGLLVEVREAGLEVRVRR